jgi:alpha-tubulin suppressor-like RCC1 family protein
MRNQWRAWAIAVVLGVAAAGVVAAPAASPASASDRDEHWPGNRAGAAWGFNGFGQLGDASWTDQTLPVDIYGLSDAVRIAAGHYHSLAVMADGTLRTWGAGGSGQLGYGSYVNASAPGTVPGLRDMVEAAGGWTHSLAVRADGTVWAWGDNRFGQLGDGTTTQRFSPVQVLDITGAVAVAAGREWSLALTSDGSVWAWGRSQWILGTAAPDVQSTIPIRVVGLESVVAIAAGAQHAMAITTDAAGARSVWTWGQNSVGQLGAQLCTGIICGVRVPHRVSGLPSIAAIAAADLTSVALGVDGTVWTWGSNGFGALGDGSTVGFRYEPRAVVAEGSAMIRVAAGGYHVALARVDGVVFGWGSNRYGELGNGATATQSGIVEVGRLTKATQLAAGEYHTLALYASGLVGRP